MRKTSSRRDRPTLPLEIDEPRGDVGAHKAVSERWEAHRRWVGDDDEPVVRGID